MRLIFSDKNDEIYTDDNYKNAKKDYYMKEIQADLDWYGMVNAKIGIHNRVFVNNDSPKEVVNRIIKEYNLKMTIVESKGVSYFFQSYRKSLRISKTG